MFAASIGEEVDFMLSLVPSSPAASRFAMSGRKLKVREPQFLFLINMVLTTQ
jgi:hypothetical protein